LKLIITVVRTSDEKELLDELFKRGLTATKLASTGGFLKQGNTTLLIGLADEKTDEVVQLIKSVCKPTTSVIPQMPPSTVFAPGLPTRPVEITSGGAKIFVLDVADYHE
jgi:uncharacterized protein YaaQ